MQKLSQERLIPCVTPSQLPDREQLFQAWDENPNCIRAQLKYYGLVLYRFCWTCSYGSVWLFENLGTNGFLLLVPFSSDSYPEMWTMWYQCDNVSKWHQTIRDRETRQVLGIRMTRHLNSKDFFRSCRGLSVCVTNAQVFVMRYQFLPNLTIDSRIFQLVWRGEKDAGQLHGMSLFIPERNTSSTFPVSPSPIFSLGDFVGDYCGMWYRGKILETLCT